MISIENFASRGSRMEQLSVLAVSTAFLLVLTALAVRLMYGVDLSDEAYYAAFVTEWLKTGLTQASFLTIHQTAALFPYLPSRLFVAITGSTDGIVLFLRILFLSFSTAAALLWWCFMARVAPPLIASLSAIVILSFVPFGLPAPSYNTIGMQALTAAIACLGCGMSASSGPARKRWYLGSAAAWTIGVVAYPTFGVVVVILITVLIYSGDRLIEQGRLYAVFIGILVSAGIGIAVAFLSIDKITGSIRYLNLINNVSGFDLKIQKTANLFFTNPLATSLFAAAACLGVMRIFMKPVVFAGLLTILVAATFMYQPALFVRSHDVIFLLTLAGLGHLIDLAAPATSSKRILAIGYTISLMAALTTSTTAVNGLYNFCIGGLPAAALVLSSIANDRSIIAIMGSATMSITALLTILSTSLFYFYGEPYGAESMRRERVSLGPQRGLLVLAQDNTLIREVQIEVAGIIGNGTLAIFSILKSGIILETQARLSMLMTFPLPTTISIQGLAFTREYYTRNRPDFVILFEDGGIPVNPMRDDFDLWYHQIRRIETPSGPLLLFQRS